MPGPSHPAIHTPEWIHHKQKALFLPLELDNTPGQGAAALITELWQELLPLLTSYQVLEY